MIFGRESSAWARLLVLASFVGFVLTQPQREYQLPPKKAAHPHQEIRNLGPMETEKLRCSWDPCVVLVCRVKALKARKDGVLATRSLEEANRTMPRQEPRDAGVVPFPLTHHTCSANSHDQLSRIIGMFCFARLLRKPTQLLCPGGCFASIGLVTALRESPKKPQDSGRLSTGNQHATCGNAWTPRLFLGSLGLVRFWSGGIPNSVCVCLQKAGVCVC